jgi:hypothetical protein
MPNVNTTSIAQFHDLITDVRTSTQGGLYAVGQYREENGKGYRYFKYDDGTANLTCTIGKLLYQVGSTDWTCTHDVSDTDRNLVAGVAAGVVADGGYGWMQVFGQCTVTTNGDDDIAKADAVIASAAGDGTADSTAQDTAPTNKIVGWALAADVDASDTVLTFLTMR